MNFIPTEIADILIIEPQVFGDERGFFMETYQAARFHKAGIPTDFVQDNHSGSRRGTLRGLHYQIQQTQCKLVRAVVGEIFDVAVDIRRGSPSFGKWVGSVISAQNRRQMWIPCGFAHGIYVLSDWAEVLYKTTDYYAPEYERTLLWNDPEIGIQWPFPNEVIPILSAKDTRGIPFSQAELFD
jgi:dTDP-4-dehydrorhamnose 3,5-epimerase